MTDQAVEDWDGEVGERWLAHLDVFESMIAPVGEAIIAKAGFRPGEKIAEVGCGGGASSLDIARAIGAEGHLTAIDISELLLTKARDRIAAAGLGNVSFLCADGQTATPTEAPFDRLFSRFGVMFFEDTTSAFANMRSWLKPGGEMVFACWGPPDQNPWIGTMGAIASKYVEMPERAPDAPGPFRMADPDATRAMLEAAGFGDIDMALWRGEQHLGGAGADPESATDFALKGLGLGEAISKEIARCGDPEIEPRLRAELREAFAPFHRDGAVRMDAAAWFVTARNPG